MKRFWLAAALATFALTLGFKPVDAQEENLKFHLVPASDTIQTCLPDEGSATQYDLCRLPHRTAGAALRRGSIYRGLHD